MFLGKTNAGKAESCVHSQIQALLPTEIGDGYFHYDYKNMISMIWPICLHDKNESGKLFRVDALTLYCLYFIEVY